MNRRSRLVGCPAGSVRRGVKAYVFVKVGTRAYKAAHIVFALAHGRWPALHIDHINGDSLDDSPTNLREATVTQNAWNHKGRKKATSLPMGIRANPSGMFAARIQVNHKNIALGTFRTVTEAHEAYRAARAQHFGVFA